MRMVSYGLVCPVDVGSKDMLKSSEGEKDIGDVPYPLVS
jgi:hypothetical protein